MKKPTLWVERLPTVKDLSFDFCYSAKMGAKQMGHTVKTFESYSEIPSDPYNVVVGSVEMCSWWLENNGYVLPTLIDLTPFKTYLRRNSQIWTTEDVRENLKWGKGPLFVKPAHRIKAFTGFVASDVLMFDIFSERYQGEVIVQDVIDIVSEHRVYVNNNQIVGCKHYSGDCLRFPQRCIVNLVHGTAMECIDHHSYCMDFAVLANGHTVLIELNDGWAIGNYGLDPKTYYLFVRDRWLQITGVRKKMDYKF